MAKERKPNEFVPFKKRDTDTHDIAGRRHEMDLFPEMKTDGENARFLRHNLEIGQLGKIDMNDVDAVQKRIAEYFAICEKNDMKPSLPSFTLALGFDRREIWVFMQKAEHPSVAVVKKVYNLLDAQLVDYMQNGKINPVSGIFLAKNFFGYSDKTELEISAEGGAEDPNKLFDKYMGDVVTDDDIVEIKDE